MALQYPEWRKWWIRRLGSQCSMAGWVRVDVALLICQQLKYPVGLQRLLGELVDKHRGDVEDDPRYELIDAINDQWIINLTRTGRTFLVQPSDAAIHAVSLKRRIRNYLYERQTFPLPIGYLWKRPKERRTCHRLIERHLENSFTTSRTK